MVGSLSRPRRNVTGIEVYIRETGGKKVQLISELVPEAAVIALLVNPSSLIAQSQVREASEAAHLLGRQLHILNAVAGRDFELAFTTLAVGGAGALTVGADPMFLTSRDQPVGLAARHATPTIWPLREYIFPGGLIRYGDRLTIAYREGRIESANPTELPVNRPNKFKLVINLRTAKALGLALPPLLLARADEVTE